MLRLSQIQIFLLLVLFNELVRAASAATSDPQLEEPPATSSDNRPKRTLFNIVLGCASTIVISTWRSVHPNIPPQQSYLRRIFRKLDLLICTIIAPEILPLWALKQWIAATRVADIYNNRGREGMSCATVGMNSDRILKSRPAPKETDRSIFARIKDSISTLIISICTSMFVWTKADREKWFSLDEIADDGNEGGYIDFFSS